MKTLIILLALFPAVVLSDIEVKYSPIEGHEEFEDDCGVADVVVDTIEDIALACNMAFEQYPQAVLVSIQSIEENATGVCNILYPAGRIENR